MVFLIIFAFLAGVVTILSPCILPILPIVLSGSLTGGKRRPLGIVAGFILSFTFFTLFLTSIVKATGISADVLRNASVVIITAFGISLLLPNFQAYLERFFSKLASLVPTQQSSSQKTDYLSGILVGISLGLVWTPCVGPILASIITLAATSKVTTDAVFITLAYSIGTSVPLLAITYGGRRLLQKVPWIVVNSAKIQKAFGVLMIATALAIYFQIDRKFQTYILQKFPNYGVGLTKIEDNPTVRQEIEKLKEQKPQTPVVDLFNSNLGTAPEFVPGGKWFNLTAGKQVLSMSELRGKVVLVDFWTYTCINCIRTLPYIKSWWAKYKNKGLVIVGVHTPEFEFEKNPENVAKAIKDFGLEYPIMQDNDYATWTAYNNQYWPAKYFIDVHGVIRHTHFGEGDYDDSERWIQNLLKEAGLLSNDMPIANPEYSVYSKTPETYVGYNRIDHLASPELLQKDKPATYSNPGNLSKNSFAFGGIWNVGEDHAMPTKGAKLAFHFDSKEVFLVMRPIDVSGRLKVFIDDKLVTPENAGADAKDGIVTVDGDRLYKLIKLPSPGDHLLRLEFLDDNLELYAFTFG